MQPVLVLAVIIMSGASGFPALAEAKSCDAARQDVAAVYRGFSTPDSDKFAVMLDSGTVVPDALMQSYANLVTTKVNALLYTAPDGYPDTIMADFDTLIGCYLTDPAATVTISGTTYTFDRVFPAERRAELQRAVLAGDKTSPAIACVTVGEC